MKNNNNVFKIIYDKIFKYTPEDNYTFYITPENQQSIEKVSISPSKDLEPTNISSNLKQNLDYLKSAYNSLISSDVVIREFEFSAGGKTYNSAIIYIDGMSDIKEINNFVLKPLMQVDKFAKNPIKEFNINDIIVKRVKKIKLIPFIQNRLLPFSSVEDISKYSDLTNAVNSGNCVLLVDSISTAFNIDCKGFKQRSVESPKNEIIIRGSQEAFVENLRTNTSILRRLINNEDLITENCIVGDITKTKIAVCYLKNIANNDLVAEVKYRINNLNVDNIVSSGQLEQLIQDNPRNLFPQLIATERPDKATEHLLEGRVIIIVNNSPYVLIAPGVLNDFLASPEDTNLKYQFSNMLKFLRMISLFFALFLPGIYVAVSSYHQELLPTELLFTIEAARETVPFPTIFEILVMEFSFELIREAGLRVPSPIGPTIGIVGGLILGEAAVSANLVSPILIIIVAITAICSFSIPDFSLNFTVRIYRFLYIFLGYIAGFLGIAIGFFIQLISLCSLKSFGCPYVVPYMVRSNNRTSTSYFLPPIWKRENRSSVVSPKKKYSQGKISMLWKFNNLK